MLEGELTFHLDGELVTVGAGGLAFAPGGVPHTLANRVEQPHHWPALEGRPSDERAYQIQTDLLLASDAVLMGRRTYDSFAAVWPTLSDPASNRMNTAPCLGP